TKVVSYYIVEFRRLIARLNITNKFLIFIFYLRLKEDIKDKLAKIINTLKNFLLYIKLTIKINT
ncbi:hypothetical protein LZ32DRAFT_541807, partial [Colletotrichum eremochloae]